jgi:hypothetical protein
MTESSVVYDINWEKVKTISDLKCILQIVADKIIIDHKDDADLLVYEKVKHFLITE